MDKKKELIIDENMYSLEIIKRAVYANIVNTSILLSFIEKGKIMLIFEIKNKDFKISDFIDDLNHYLFLDSQAKEAEPIKKAVIEGVLKKISQMEKS